MLHINNACIAFGTEVLFSGLNLNLERGKTACIVGQSGCGKTSLLNAVMGFVPLKEGTIKVGDTLLDKSTIDIIRRQIAWIPQELALPFEWVKEMVALPGTMIGQILGGSSPNVAIKYQMMIMVITFTASMLSLMITISLASRRSFDAYGKLLEVTKETKK